jgi:hypothetical protein
MRGELPLPDDQGNSWEQDENAKEPWMREPYTRDPYWPDPYSGRR